MCHLFKWRNRPAVSPFIFFILLCCGCGEGKKNETSRGASPALSAKESLKHFQLEDGFDIRLVASEPLVQAPVAMDFDAGGRLWVVEMQGYMPDTSGTGENTSPTGKIVILEDKDHDGVMDSRKVFLDSLVLPRAICFYKQGVLIAEPPRLWFVEIHDDTAGAKYVVDDHYAVGGNVEHQPNGLLRGLDNWIYNAKSDTRYREINGKWEKEHTHFRGQWGITQDDYGRLFYNNNSANLLGDFFLPSLGAWNPDQQRVSGFDESIVADNRTYPVHPTPGVNRGYQEGVLDDSLRLVRFTAACGPVIYRGGLFGPEYEGNAFVAGPAANLVKRDILYHDGFKIKGKQAYHGKEFLASDDERFRPVSLYNGPDGALYVVDMYRGIIQDVTYLTSYLKKEIEKRGLQQPLNRGRIYKVVPKGKKTAIPVLNNRPAKEWVDLLDDPDSWVRETAQRLIVDGDKKEVASLLRRKLHADTFLVGRIHAFWTLEGLGELKDADLYAFLRSGNIRLQEQAIAAAVSEMNARNAKQWAREGMRLFENKTRQLAPYTGFLAAKAMQYDPADAQKLLLRLALRYSNDPYVTDAVISGLHGREAAFLKLVEQRLPDSTAVLYNHLKKAVANAEKRSKERNKKNGKKYAKGKILFATYCKICHGEDGAGIRSLGAPLNGSQWVTGDKEKLLAIVLHGLTGPVKVGDKTYREPEVGGEMPGFAQNKKLSDDDIAQILSYIRNAWNNNAPALDSEDVRNARTRYQNRTDPFTMEELE